MKILRADLAVECQAKCRYPFGADERPRRNTRASDVGAIGAGMQIVNFSADLNAFAKRAQRLVTHARAKFKYRRGWAVLRGNFAAANNDGDANFGVYAILAGEFKHGQRQM